MTPDGAGVQHLDGVDRAPDHMFLEAAADGFDLRELRHRSRPTDPVHGVSGPWHGVSGRWLNEHGVSGLWLNEHGVSGLWTTGSGTVGGGKGAVRRVARGRAVRGRVAAALGPVTDGLPGRLSRLLLSFLLRPP